MTQQQKMNVARKMAQMAKRTAEIQKNKAAQAGHPSTPQSARTANSTPRSARGTNGQIHSATPTGQGRAQTKPTTPAPRSNLSSVTNTLSNRTNQTSPIAPSTNGQSTYAPHTTAPPNLHSVSFLKENNDTFDRPEWPEVDERDDHKQYQWIDSHSHAAYEAKAEQIVNEYLTLIVGEAGSALYTKKNGGHVIRVTSSHDEAKSIITILSSEAFVFNVAGVIIKGAIFPAEYSDGFIPVLYIKQFGENRTENPVRPIAAFPPITNIPNCHRPFPFATRIFTDDKDSIATIRAEIAQIQLDFKELQNKDNYAYLHLSEMMKPLPYIQILKQSLNKIRKAARAKIMERAKPIDFTIFQARHDLNLKQIVEMSAEQKKAIQDEIIKSFGPEEDPDSDAIMEDHSHPKPNSITIPNHHSNKTTHPLSQNHSNISNLTSQSHNPFILLLDNDTDTKTHQELVKAFHDEEKVDAKADQEAKKQLDDIMDGSVLVGGNEVKKSRLAKPLFQKPDETRRWKEWTPAQIWQKGRKGKGITRLTIRAPTLEGKSWMCESVYGTLKESILKMKDGIRGRMIEIYKLAENEAKELAKQITLFAEVGGGLYTLVLSLNGSVLANSAFGSFRFNKRIAVIECPKYLEEFLTIEALQSGIKAEIAVFRLYQSTRRLEGIRSIGHEVARTPPCIDSEHGSICVDFGSKTKLHKAWNTNLFWCNHPSDSSTEFHSNILETDRKDKILKFSANNMVAYHHSSPQTNAPLQRNIWDEKVHKRYGFDIETIDIQVGKMLKDELQVFHMTAYSSWKQSITNQPQRRKKRAKKAALTASWD